jgi:hypothetical protein
MLNTTEAEPFAPKAVTVYEEDAATAAGVPEIMPVEEFRLKPVGSAGFTLYEDAVPLRIGLLAAIATPLVYTGASCA